MMQILDMSRHYGPPSSFLTLSFADAENVRALRSTYRTIDNRKFPAVFEEGCIHGKNVTEYMKILYEASTVRTNAILPIHPEHTREYRENMARKNPIAYVAESKKMINDFCSILLGLSPENFFGSDEGETRRRTRYFKVYKGVVGHVLAYIGVVEDHAKGTIHYHLIFFGGLPPYVLQRFACMPEISKAIAKVLNTMYRAKLPDDCNVSHVIATILKEWTTSGYDASTLRQRHANPHLLGRYEPIGGGHQNPLTSVSYETICRETVPQADDQTRHRHMETCHHGSRGITGCRLDRKMASCNGTHPVRLIPIDDLSAFMNDNHHLGGSEEIEKDKYPYTIIDPAVPVEGEDPTVYHLRDPIKKRNASDETAIAWELDRPRPMSLFESALDEIDRTRAEGSLRACLKNYPHFHANIPFWTWLQGLDDASFTLFIVELDSRLFDANNYVVEHNSIILYCIGAHNNVQLLGSVEQATGAVFYVGPYMVKNKFPLLHSLTILDDCIKHVQGHPSQAEDTGTMERTTKHVLQRTINKFHLKMEYSEYQIAASLLGLPNVICSDSCIYSDPMADVAYHYIIQRDGTKNPTRALDRYIQNLHREQEETSPNPTMVNNGMMEDFHADIITSDVPMTMNEIHEQITEEVGDMHTSNSLPEIQELRDYNLGRVRPFKLHKETPHQAITLLIPQTSFYSSRGAGLACLNRDEYASIVDIKATLAEKEPPAKVLQRPSFVCRLSSGVTRKAQTQYCNPKTSSPSRSKTRYIFKILPWLEEEG